MVFTNNIVLVASSTSLLRLRMITRIAICNVLNKQWKYNFRFRTGIIKLLNVNDGPIY
jgi:hypothetical protein